MKKHLLSATLLLATLTGCSDEIYHSDSIVDGGNQVSFIVDEFMYGDGTRASYTPREDCYQFSWTEGDTLGVFGTETVWQVEFPIGNNTNGNKVSFDGGNFGVRPGNSYVAYYPYNYDIPHRTLSFTGMNTTTQVGNGSTAHLGKQDIMTSVYTQVDPEGNVNFEMKHLCSLLCFEVNAPKIGTYTKLKFNCGSGVNFYSDYKYILGEEDSKLVPDTKKAFSEYVVNLKDVKTTTADEIITVYAMIPSDKFRTNRLAVTLVMADGTEHLYSSPTYVDGNKPVLNFYPEWEAGKAYKYKLNRRFADEEGREYVDMGIRDNDGEPIYFGAWNIGAESPEESGLYFAWGEIVGSDKKDIFDQSTYSLYKSDSYIKYVSNVNGSCADLVLEDDAANANWGGNWRMPTQAEFVELLQECTHEFTTIKDVDVLKLTSKLNGETIILPVAGGCQENVYGKGYVGIYWTSTLNSSDANNGDCLFIAYKDIEADWVVDAISAYSSFSRFYGCSIRPVYSASKTQIQTISINESYMEVNAKESVKITVNIIPAISTYKSLQWTSSNEDVAKVSQDGTVTGVSEGVAVITATSRDGSNVSARCEVRVFQKHEKVDLGLKADDGKPVLWATCNIGAGSPEEFGLYFAWGETTGYKKEEAHTFDWKNYTLGNVTQKVDMYKYCTSEKNGVVDNLTLLDPEDDAAFMLWGDNWRMPNEGDVDKLLFENGIVHHFKEENINGVKCVSIKTEKSESSLLLPYAGMRDGNNNYEEVTTCRYWMANLVVDPSSSSDYSFNGRIIYIEDTDTEGIYNRRYSGYYRYRGLPIRPVYHEYQKITGITLNKSTVKLANGGSETLTASVNEDAYYKRVKWSSSNENIVTVSKDGKITAVAPGTATIIAKAKDRSGKTATCTVTVAE